MPGGKQSGVSKVNAVTGRLGIGHFCEGNVRCRQSKARRRVSAVFFVEGS